MQFALAEQPSAPYWHRARRPLFLTESQYPFASQAKRDCVEEIEILLRYGQHKNIISLRDMFESPEEVRRIQFLYDGL